MFDHADANGDGTISVVELMVALRHDPELASMLRLPSHIHQEDGTRIAFERVFSEFDDDHDRLITWDEFLRHVASWRESPTMIGAQHDGTSAAIMNERRPGSRLVASIADGDVRSSRYVAGERPGLLSLRLLSLQRALRRRLRCARRMPRLRERRVRRWTQCATLWRKCSGS